MSNRFSATVHLDPFESNWPTGLTKLNCTVAVSPRTSTLHSSAISVYICVFPFLPPSTRLRFVCVPFCPRPPSSSSSSLPPSSLFFPSSTSTSWKKKSFPTFLTHSSILYTCQSKAFSPLHLCSIGGCIAEHWDTSYMPIQFCTEHLKRVVTMIPCNWQVTEPMSVFKTLKVNRAPCLIFVGTVCYVVCYFCACAVWVRLQFASVTEAGCHVLSDTAHMSCAGLMSINLCPASFLLQSTAVQVRGPGGRKKETSVDTHDTINQ